MQSRPQAKFPELLRQQGLRSTPGRVAILETLKKEGKPLSAEALVKAVQGQLDQASIYRSLESFASAGIIRRADVGHRHMHYELAMPTKHHHHYVCVDCGASALHS